MHSSPNIKKEVLVAGALQPVIGLLRFVNYESSGVVQFQLIPE